MTNIRKTYKITGSYMVGLSAPTRNYSTNKYIFSVAKITRHFTLPNTIQFDVDPIEHQSAVSTRKSPWVVETVTR